MQPDASQQFPALMKASPPIKADNDYFKNHENALSEAILP